MFSHKQRLLDVAAQLKRSAHAALGLAIVFAVIPVAGQRTHGTTFLALKVTSQVATPGAESAVYDCLVNFCTTNTKTKTETKAQCRDHGPDLQNILRFIIELSQVYRRMNL